MGTPRTICSPLDFYYPLYIEYFSHLSLETPPILEVLIVAKLCMRNIKFALLTIFRCMVQWDSVHSHCGPTPDPIHPQKPSLVILKL